MKVGKLSAPELTPSEEMPTGRGVEGRIRNPLLVNSDYKSGLAG